MATIGLGVGVLVLGVDLALRDGGLSEEQREGCGGRRAS